MGYQHIQLEIFYKNNHKSTYTYGSLSRAANRGAEMLANDNNVVGWTATCYNIVPCDSADVSGQMMLTIQSMTSDWRTTV